MHKRIVPTIVLACMILAVLPIHACFYPKPEILMIDPARATNDGPVELSIIGRDFIKGARVVLSAPGREISPSRITFVSKTQIDCTFDLKGQAVGSLDVTVVNRSAKRTAVFAGAFTIEYPAPVLTGIEPGQSDAGAKVALAVRGDKFRSGFKIELAAKGMTALTVTDTVCTSATQGSCELDLASVEPGKYDLILTNDDGKSAVLTEAFVVNALPEVKTSVPGDNSDAESPEMGSASIASASTRVPGVKPDSDLTMEKALGSIFFDYDRAVIRGDQSVILRQAVEEIKARPDLYVVLGGNADQRGPAGYNLWLSQKRAETVKAFLIRMGIDASHIIVYAYGEEFPVKTDNTSAAWAFNRRVDISLWNGIPTREQANPGATPP
ncbi:MAG: OmpA family protein [Patescibacteria group bacterium]